MQDATWSFARDTSIVNGYAFSDDTLFLEIYFRDAKPRIVIEFFSDMAQPDPTPLGAFSRRSSPSGHPIYEQGLGWVKERLAECCEAHVCHSSQHSPLPDRILSFSASLEGNMTVKLTESTDTFGKYATLSHRWGPGEQFITTTTNLNDRKRDIPWIELPKTFQDAIRYCWELGISYIWIDALCILQDDAKDWETQSAKMADIYHESHITLAATWSDCNTAGCFPTQPPTYVEHPLNMQSTTHATCLLKVRHRLPHWTINSTAQLMQNNPLLSRAWVFQERVLSPRVLHFCLHEMIWECGEQIICECGGLPEIPNLKTQFALSAKLKVDDKQGETEASSRATAFGLGPSLQSEEPRGEVSPNFDEEDDREQARQVLGEIALQSLQLKRNKALAPIQQWHGIVEQYSKLDLTKQTDRLPALSGLASRMSRFLGAYHAGLWESSLFYDLAWRVDKLCDSLYCSKEYRGPSWSWASVNTAIRYMDYEKEFQRWYLKGLNRQDRRHIPRPTTTFITTFRIPIFKSMKLKNKGDNCFGEVLSAALFVRGLLRSARLSYGKDLVQDLVTHRPELEITSPSIPAWPVPSLTLPFLADFVLNETNSDRIRNGMELFLFALFPRVSLVLTETGMSTRDAKIYKRVGIFELAEQIESGYRIDWLNGAEYRDIIII
ncbi:HET-domain-containing protein [Thozetella sp. PMI_491]|nr:HET-domain-containing protein [Thozetella sp. PMI_491]